MTYRLYYLLFLSLIYSYGNAQEWKISDPDRSGKIISGRYLPTAYTLATTNRLDFEKTLRSGLVNIPLPGGDLHTFKAVSFSNFEPGLTLRYPGIRSYAIMSTTNNRIKGKIDVSPHGIHAVLDHPDGEIYIDPASDHLRDQSLIYFTRDFRVDPALRAQYSIHEHHFKQDTAAFLNQKPIRSPFARSGQTEVMLHTFRLAVACTGEYTAKHNGTKAGALAAINTALNRINFIMEREVAISLKLIDETEDLIFLNGSNDPFTNGNASQMALENNNYLLSTLGSNAYDVGHVFGTNCSGVVGLSGGVGIVCSNLKAFGSSCEISTNDRFYIGIVCHELGHQFGAQHTWNNCPNQQDQFNSPTAFEPGSGTTIMSYAGACGNQNIQGSSDPYYHGNSIEAIRHFVTTAGNCGEAAPLSNNLPTVDIARPGGFFIPVETPFRLDAMAEDIDGDSLTYCWEQFDPGVSRAAYSPLGNPQGDAPIFRSLAPTENPTRFFPALEKVIDQDYDNSEVLPTYDRKLTFRATVRDHAAGGGGVVWDDISFRASELAGPFVLRDSLLPEEINAGDFIETLWDVANTNVSPVNCRRVNLLLSTDGGFTYSDTLITNTPNDGAEHVLIPDIESSDVRLMVQAADNIFFDINDENLTVSRSTVAGFGLDIGPHQQRTCLPSSIVLRVESFAFGGFSDVVSITPIELPDGVQVESQIQVNPGETKTIDVDLSQVTEPGEYQLQFEITSSLGETTQRTVVIDAVSSDFSELALVGPVQGMSGVNTRPLFEWMGSSNADGYEIEVDDSPLFDNPFVGNTLSATTLSLDEVLDENTLYYWRVRPHNVCGEGEYSDISAFHSISLACESYMASDLPQSLSQSVIKSIESKIDITGTGTVSDVNISAINGFHESFGDLYVMLKSPSGTLVPLVTMECGFTNRTFTIGFDDQSLQSFTCQAPFNGQIFQPQGVLAEFNGEDINGTWSLVVADSTIGSGGRIEGFTLELCGSLMPVAPQLVHADTLLAAFATETVVDRQNLEASDDQASPNALIYTLVAAPVSGSLMIDGDPISIGAKFSQEQVNSGELAFSHTSDDSIPDSFILTLVDGTGGWLGPINVPIKVGRNIVPVKETNLLEGLKLYPNPVGDWFLIANEIYRSRDAEITIFDLSGRNIFALDVPLQSISKFEVSDLVPGIYFLKILMPEGSAHFKFVKK